jgi:hypothetical protein
MKTVFKDSQEVCHIFAQQTQKEGRNGRTNIFFEGKTIYSYGYNWILGYFYDDKTIFLNTQKNSLTTNSQAMDLRSAVSHKNVIHVGDNNFLNAIKNQDSKEHLLIVCENQIRKLIENYEYHLINLWSNKKAITLEKHKNEVLYNIGSILEAAKVFEVLISDEITNLISEVSKTQDFKELTKNLKEIKTKQDLEAKELQAKLVQEKLVLSKLAIKKWINNKELSQKERNLLKYSPDIKLKLATSDKETIETSLGARFSLKDAKKALKIIRAVKASKQEYDGGKDIKLGHYEVTKISKKGDVTSQCHFIYNKEIERLAKKIGL